MNFKNTWIKGINTDNSFLKTSNQNYLSLQGGKLVTVEGGTSGAIETEKGNKKLFSFPTVPQIYRLSIIQSQDIYGALYFSFVNEFEGFTMEGLNNTKDLYNVLTTNNVISNHIAIGDIRIDYSEDYENITIWVFDNVQSIYSSNTPFIKLDETSKIEDPVVIGGGLFDKDIVLVTASKESEESNGQFWKFSLRDNKILLKDGTFLQDGNPLLTEEHLLYSGKLNLDIQHYITKFIVNIETEYLGRFYINDRKNPIMSFNVTQDFPMNTPIGLINRGEPVFFPEIKTTEVFYGGKIPNGTVLQYFYRFKTGESGYQSSVSPGSELMFVTDKTPKNSSYNNSYRGSDGSNDTEEKKSVKIKIEGLNTIYQSIELIYGMYSSEGVPVYKTIKELLIPPSGILEYIHTGREQETIIPLEEINARTNNITKANDIAVKDNRMIVFGPEMYRENTKFDTRAYRFNNEQKALLKDQNIGNIIIDGTETIDWDIVPKEHNAINPYNKEEDWSEWYNQHQYKFQSDGHTLGGEGKNISYKFVTLKLIGEEDVTINRQEPPYIYSGRYPEQKYITLGKDRSYDISKEFKDFRSPIINSFAKGYAREEVYRIYFNAYDNNGNPMYANWVADIRMPAEWDVCSYITENINTEEEFLNNQTTAKFIVGETVNNKVHLYSLGIDFKIKDISVLGKEISGYSFSAVKRGQQDKTKLSQGILQPTYKIRINDTITNDLYAEHPFATSNIYKIFELETSLQSGNINDIKNIMSYRSIDDIEYGNYGYGEKDYIRQNSFYQTYHVPLIDPGNITYYASIKKAYNLINQYLPIQTISLKDSIWRDVPDTVRMQDLNTLENASNLSGVENTYVMLSSYNLISELSIPTGTIVNNNGNPALEILLGLFRYTKSRILLGESEKRIDYRTFNMDGTLQSDNSWENTEGIIIASYKRFLQKQYGGDTYVDRQSNISYPVTPIIESNIDNVKAFSGDVCVSYFPFYNIRQEINEDWWSPSNIVNAYYRNSNYVINAITESEINPYYASGDMWLLDEQTPLQYYQQNVTDYYERWPMAYNVDKYMEYPSVYKQKKDVNIYSAKTKFSNDSNVFPAGIAVSNKKINGDRVDSWLNFPINQLKEVENSLGKIIYGDVIKDKLIFIQEKGIGIQSINEKALQFNDETNTRIILGNGDLLGEHGYISRNSGTLHNSSVLNTEYGLYYYDAIHNNLKKYNTESNLPLSDIMGLYSYIKENISLDEIRHNDDPINGKGIAVAKDELINRIYYSFLGKTSVEIYEPSQIAESFPYVHSNIYINTLDHPISVHPTSPNLYYLENSGKYNNYFGTNQPMVLKFIVNGEPDMEKTLNNLFWKSECYNLENEDIYDKSINRIRIYNNYQDTGYKTDIKRTLRQWAHKVGLNTLSSKRIDRMRNEWFIVEMIFDNRNNYKLVLHDVISSINFSHSGMVPY